MKISFIKTDPRAQTPQYKTEGSAAWDIHALLDDPLIMGPGFQAMIRTGLKVHIADPRYGMQIIPRSGTGTKGLVMGHGTGLVDSDYQGEIFIPLWNRTNMEQTVMPGDRIAQAVIVSVVQAEFEEVAEFAALTSRGEGGFGSTGR